MESRGLRWYESDGRRRGFCGVCGASVFWERAERPTVSIAAGTLEQPTGLAPSHHIFAVAAADYYEIADGLERR